MRSKIYHLTFHDGGEDYYFGSIAAICDTFGEDAIKVTAHALYRAKLKERPFENDVITIRFGTLIRKKKKA